MDIGRRDEARSRCALGGGESLARAATFCDELDGVMFCGELWPCGPENVVDCGDLGGPKVDINERTKQGELACVGYAGWTMDLPRLRTMMVGWNL